jgi:hypothetical protein
MRALAASLLVAVVSVFGLAAWTDDDPCKGHVTPDGITADQMGPCDEMAAVR